MIMLVVGMILVTPALTCPPNVQTEQDSSNTLIVSYEACNWATSEVCEGEGLC